MWKIASVWEYISYKSQRKYFKIRQNITNFNLGFGLNKSVQGNTNYIYWYEMAYNIYKYKIYAIL